MSFLPQLVFAAVLIAAIWRFSKKAGTIARNIHLGKAQHRSDNPRARRAKYAARGLWPKQNASSTGSRYASLHCLCCFLNHQHRGSRNYRGRLVRHP